MKTFTLSKKDLSYMGPIDATLNGLNVAIQVYVINTVFKRLGINPSSQARYDLDKGELYVMEESDKKLVPPGVPKAPAKPADAKPTEVKK